MITLITAEVKHGVQDTVKNNSGNQRVLDNVTEHKKLISYLCFVKASSRATHLLANSQKLQIRYYVLTSLIVNPSEVSAS